MNNSAGFTNNRRAYGIGLFRIIVLVFAVILLCQAIWILAPELSQPEPINFPINPQSEASPASGRDAAHRAARLGVIRGDLWAEDALHYPDVFWPSERTSERTQDSATVERAHAAAQQALAYAPYDARIWLMLASLESRFDWLNGRASAALQMSYYTGEDEVELIPLRLHLSVTLPIISDVDFQRLVRHDIQIIASHKPDLKATISSAYRQALPAGQSFIEKALKELDPTLLSTLQSK